MWGRNQYDDVIRITGIYDVQVDGALTMDQLKTCNPVDTAKELAQTGHRTIHCRPYGLTLRPAIRLDDPCLVRMPAKATLYPFSYDPHKIDPTEGNLLVTAAAYKATSVDGITQTPEEQAEQVRARIAVINSTSICDGSQPPSSQDRLFLTYHCGREPSTLLALTPFDPTPPLTTCETSGNAPGCIPFGASNIDRLNACMAYWNKSLLTYTGNPYQLVSPQYGTTYGVEGYTTVSPQAAYDGSRIDSDISLKGIQEFWYTTEPVDVDPKNRGPILLRGIPGVGGRDWIHFDLTSPSGANASGQVALYVNGDTDPTQL
jgi:hypothetical protein